MRAREPPVTLPCPPRAELTAGPPDGDSRVPDGGLVTGALGRQALTGGDDAELRGMSSSGLGIGTRVERQIRFGTLGS